MPTVLVVGGDTAAPMAWRGDDLVQALPNVRRQVIARAGHDPWFEQPGAFFVAVRRALGP